MQEPPLAFDREAFARDIQAIKDEVDRSLGQEDLDHLLKIRRWARACSALGYGTAWIMPNLFSAALMGIGNTATWTMLAHHVVHRGYDKVPGVPPELTSKHFAKGSRRLLDWPDWMDPEAWAYEHNVLHHFHTGELDDPDLVEENLKAVREADLPEAVKLAVVGFYALTWKLTYYAPNTFQILARREQRQKTGAAGSDARGDERFLDAFDPRTEQGRAFLKRCVLPYALYRFVGLPLLFAPLGPLAPINVAINSVIAEMIANVHSFVIIATNHAGDDMYRYDGRGRGKTEYFIRQVLGSVDFETGGDVRDFMQGFLNYQIEHHLFPDIPMRQYQRIQPKVKAVCEKHGVPYVQEGVGRRVKKLVDIMVGRTSMKKVDTSAKAAAHPGEAPLS